MLRKLVYENKVNQQDAELMKLSRYYIAHVNSASMLEEIFGYAELEGPFGEQSEVGLRVIAETTLVPRQVM